MTRVIFLKAIVCAGLLIGFTLGTGVAASAQSPVAGTTVSAGYSYLHELGNPGVTYGTGFAGSVAWTPVHTVSLVGELGANFRNPAGVSQQLFAALGGVSLAGQMGPHLVAFAQGLVGLERYSEVGFSENGLAIQPGVGVHWFFTPNLAVRGQADYRWVHAGGDSFNELRFVAGLAFAF